MSNGSRSASSYFHHASAFGIAGKIDRPIQHTIPTQAAISLSPGGGHGTHRVDNYNVPGILSFSAAYVTVGGGEDIANGCHATYARSVIEDLNICDMFTADKVVSQISIYHPCNTNAATPQEPNFSIAGSYFENLRIAGHEIDIKLNAHPFNNHTYTDFQVGGTSGKKPAERHRDWMIGSHIAQELNGTLKRKDFRDKLEHNAKVLDDLGKVFQEWDKTRSSAYSGSYRCSAVDHKELESCIRNSGLINFGGVIAVPRFGVIFLGELVIHRNQRQFTMFRIQMGSTHTGGIDGGGGTGGGTGIPPG